MEIEPMQNSWNITIPNERIIWKNYLIGIFILIPEICNICKKGHINLRDNNSIINPFLGKCSNYKCNREFYLRKNTLFEYHRNIPASVLYNILKLWLLEEYDVTKIASKLKTFYNVEKVDSRFIYKFIHNNRILIANYLRTVYALDPLAYKNKFQHIAIDESLFTHKEGEQVWVVRLINSENNNIRLEIVKNRYSNTLKTIVEKYVGKGNYIISDSWSGYNFLSLPNSGYIHHVYNHGGGQFGLGLDSTSRIESVWSEIKALLKKFIRQLDKRIFYIF